MSDMRAITFTALITIHTDLSDPEDEIIEAAIDAIERDVVWDVADREGDVSVKRTRE